jgi:carboxyl-terminal processing protease
MSPSPAPSRLVAAALAALALSLGLGCQASRTEPGRVTAEVPPPAVPAVPADDLHLRSFDQAWSRIAETYPHADFRGLDWEAVRDELRPRAAAAGDAAHLRPVLEEMLSRLGESHFQVIPGEAYERLEAVTEAAREAGRGDEVATEDEGASDQSPFGDLGMGVRVVGDEVLVTRVRPGGPADLGGVRLGWTLETVGDLPTAELTSAAREATADRGSEVAFRTQQALAAALQGRPGSSVALGFVDGDGEPMRLELERDRPDGEPFGFGNFPVMLVSFHSEVLPDTRVGYVRFNIFLTPVALPFTEAIADFAQRGLDGVVIDLRGNPGGLGGMVMGMAGHFVDEPGRSLGEMTMRSAALRFVANPRAPSQRFHGPVAVLIDELSASTSEVFAAGMKHAAGARVFGSTSAGMALPSIIESLPNGDRLQFATADLTDPEGRRIEGLGVEPDEQVPLERQTLLEGRDPVIDAAIAWIEKEGGSASQHPRRPASRSRERNEP